MPKQNVLRILSLIAFGVALAGCSSLELVSSRAVKSITIDGSTSDWPDSSWGEKDGLRFAVMNDDANVYVVLVVAKPDLRRQIMFRGLTLWFDPLARGKKTIGVHYPLGMGRAPARPVQGEQFPQGGQGQMEFDYISPLEQGPVRVPLLAAKGIGLKINNEQESLVYEMKIPLRSSSEQPYSVEAAPGAKISVGFDVGGFEPGSEPAGGPAAGGGGRRGGGRGPAPGGGPTRGGMSIEPLEVWATVQLAH